MSVYMILHDHCSINFTIQLPSSSNMPSGRKTIVERHMLSSQASLKLALSVFSLPLAESKLRLDSHLGAPWVLCHPCLMFDKQQG